MIAFSLPPQKQKASITLLIEDSETYESRFTSMARAFTDADMAEASEAEYVKLAKQKLITASLKKQLEELK